MSTNTSPLQTDQPERAVLRMVVGAIIFGLLLGAVVVGSAGRWDWWPGWAFVGLTLASILASRLVVYKHTPELLVERIHSLSAGDVKPWDRVLVPIVAVLGIMAILLVGGLDQRFGWSSGFSLWVQMLGLAGVAFGFYLAVWAMAANRFFSGYVRIQKERGHTVVTGGPYRFVRHPSYAGAVLAYLATPLLLGSWWAYDPAGLTIIALIIRTALEDRTLQAELPGYIEYSQHTRYRLLPGLW